jgi:glyoxylase I family protein
MQLHEIIGEYGVVSKVDVADIDASLRWYETKLGLIHDPRFDVPGWWAQLNIPHVGRTAVGLNRDAGAAGKGAEGHAGGGRGQVTTFVVADIETARQRLIDNGVDVGPIETVPHDVKLAFFRDPDGNNYGLRQNADTHPGASEIGAA